MIKRRRAFAAVIALFVLGLTSAPATTQGWKIDAIHTLPNVELSAFLSAYLGVSVEDHNVRLGGIGSDLWRDPSDEPGVFWMITDRGPNGGPNPVRTFPVPEFTPFILKVRLDNGAIDVLDALPITDGGGQAVTGLPNLASPYDETPYGCRGASDPALSLNPEGLDPEGLVRTRDGSFWLAEEYSPSIVQLSGAGAVVARFVPEALNLGASVSYPVVDSLPAIFKKRKGNRGFEGLAVSPDQDTLFAALQSPLSNPSSSVGNASRNTRILAFDPRTGEPVAEYVYRFQPASEFAAVAADMKISALSMLDQRRMLVLERTDLIARIYLVDLKDASDILGLAWDSTATSPSLEALDDLGLAAAGIRVLPKTLVIELDSADGFPEKIEGMAVLDGRTIAIANDNDFGVGSFNPAGACTLNDTGLLSRVQVIRLDRPIK